MNMNQPFRVRTAEDAEKLACLTLRQIGFHDADLTARGRDGGVDVRGAKVVAQVKAHMKPVGRPTIQQIKAIGDKEGRIAVVFSMNGYTSDAEKWANSTGVSLFAFDFEANIMPVNAAAEQLATMNHEQHSSDIMYDEEIVTNTVVLLGTVVAALLLGKYVELEQPATKAMVTSVFADMRAIQQLNSKLTPIIRQHGIMTQWASDPRVDDYSTTKSGIVITVRFVAVLCDGYQLSMLAEVPIQEPGSTIRFTICNS